MKATQLTVFTFRQAPPYLTEGLLRVACVELRSRLQLVTDCTVVLL